MFSNRFYKIFFLLAFVFLSLEYNAGTDAVCDLYAHKAVAQNQTIYNTIAEGSPTDTE